MKKAVLIFAAILLLAGMRTWADNSFTAAYDLTLTQDTNTTMAAAWEDSNSVAPDTTFVITLPDSVVLATLVDGELEADLEGLSPGVLYIMALKSVRNDSCRVSSPDTLRTLYPQIDPDIYFNQYRQMLDAESWDDTDITTLSVADTTGADSTMVYRLQKYTSVQLNVTGANPNILVSIFSGHAGGVTDRIPTEWGFATTASDTFSVASAGWTAPHTFENTGMAEQYYVRIEGQTGNGADTEVELGYMASNE